MWNEDRGYFYGVLLGDGFYEQHPSNGSPYVMLKACDRDFVEYWSKVVSRIVGKEYSVHGHVGATDKHRAQWRCKVYYRPLVVEAFEVTRDKTVIPNGILDADASVKRAFIQGLMDSEGFITFTLKPLGSTSLSLSFANTS